MASRAGDVCRNRKVLLDKMLTKAQSAVSRFWAAFRDGVAERGKAKIGDKTLLDVLHPVALVMEAQAAEDASLPSALSAAAASAAQALEATKSMKAQHGKAAAFQDKTVGLQDAGATVGMLIVARLADFAGTEV